MRDVLRVAGLAILLTLTVSTARAEPPSVEIIALSHWPVQEALKPLREVLARHTGRITVSEVNGESAAGASRLKALGLKGHIPVAVLIDGAYRFTRPDGGAVEFVNFPANASSPMGLSGRWTSADVEAVLAERLR